MKTETLPCSSDLAEQAQRLEADLAVAEAARVSDADRHARAIREQLQQKKQELQSQQAAEDAANQKLLHEQALQSLAEIESEIHAEKIKLDGLRTKYSAFASDIQRTEFRHGTMLRAYSQLKQQLGIQKG